MYGFVCTGEGRFVAHGGSPAFVGSTLSEVVARTSNHLTDAAALLERFTTAARLGGGFVEYKWRNAPDAPLLVKGAHVMRVELGSGCATAAACVATAEARHSGSYNDLTALAAAQDSSVSPAAALATGGGRARTLFCVSLCVHDRTRAEPVPSAIAFSPWCRCPHAHALRSLTAKCETRGCPTRIRICVPSRERVCVRVVRASCARRILKTGPIRVGGSVTCVQYRARVHVVLVVRNSG